MGNVELQNYHHYSDMVSSSWLMSETSGAKNLMQIQKTVSEELSMSLSSLCQDLQNGLLQA